MVQNFDDNASIASRAVQIWQILIAKANNRQTLTYGMLAECLGYKGSGVLAERLGYIMYFCAQNELPPLTVIVVNSETGKPGEGIKLNGDLDELREKVFNYNWYGLYPPTETDFKKAWEKAEKNNWNI